MNSSRSSSEILALLELAIDSCFEIASQHDEITEGEKVIIDKLREWKIKLEPQIMHTLEAPLDIHDFRSIVQQILEPVIASVIEQAESDGVITPEEQKLLDNIKAKLKF